MPMRPINQRFPKNPKPATVGGCRACDAEAATSRSAGEHNEKCWSQRIPIYLNLPAPTVAGGVVTQMASDVFEPDHDGDTFEVESIFITAEYYNESGNLTDAEEVFRGPIKMGKKTLDCLGQGEERGIPVLSYSQPQCCEGLREPLPEFGNKRKAKDVLSIEFRSEQTELVGGVVTPRAVRIRGYIKGRCKSCGYESICSNGKVESDED